MSTTFPFSPALVERLHHGKYTRWAERLTESEVARVLELVGELALRSVEQMDDREMRSLARLQLVEGRLGAMQRLQRRDQALRALVRLVHTNRSAPSTR